MPIFHNGGTFCIGLSYWLETYAPRKGDLAHQISAWFEKLPFYEVSTWSMDHFIFIWYQYFIIKMELTLITNISQILVHVEWMKMFFFYLLQIQHFLIDKDRTLNHDHALYRPKLMRTSTKLCCMVCLHLIF